MFLGQNVHILCGMGSEVRPTPEIGGIDIELLRLVTSCLDDEDEEEDFAEEDFLDTAPTPLPLPFEPKLDEEENEDLEALEEKEEEERVDEWFSVASSLFLRKTR